MSFLPEDFLLTTALARTLYFEHAAPSPILDYHCHLPPRDIAQNRRFNNLYEAWLEGDHYKWRALRANGVPEEQITGRVDPWEKFLAWARTVPRTLRNPLYHWTHLELRRYFGIDVILNEQTARRVWDEANAKLQTPELSTQGILKKFRVAAVCTTDDPVDSLEHHRAFATQGAATRMYPAFRPDKAFWVDQPAAFNEWIAKLEQTSGQDCSRLEGFLAALDRRHAYFHELGGRLSDHGLEAMYVGPCSEIQAAMIFDAARSGRPATPAHAQAFGFFLMLFLGRLDHQRGWTKQLHLGAIRNNNRHLMRLLGADTGSDSTGDFPQARALSAYLGTLAHEERLPKTILYNLNPADNYVFASMIGNFQDGTIPGKMQFGSGWWFLDQEEGMRWQIDALSNNGLLSRFVGMLTDSRSFLSYPRHEYFRRLLCGMLGTDVARGALPDDLEMLSGLVRDICFNNARDYFGLALPSL
jgi:glucuronate isomerase